MLALLLACTALAGEPATVPATWTLSAGYFGELLTHPGLFVGAARPVVASRHHALLLGGRFGAYTHPGHHTGLFLRADAAYRATAGVGLYGELLASAGVHHRFLAGPLYVRRDDGLHKTVDIGRPTFMPGVGLGAGWDLSRRGDTPVCLFVRGEGFVRTPVNHTATPGIGISIGASYTLGAS